MKKINEPIKVDELIELLKSLPDGARVAGTLDVYFSTPAPLREISINNIDLEVPPVVPQ